MILNVKDFNAQGDGISDDILAFENALAAMQDQLRYNVHGGGILFIPEGNYYLSRTLVLTHRVELQGITGREGDSMVNFKFHIQASIPVHDILPLPGSVSRLMFPAGVTGIKVAMGGPTQPLTTGGQDHAAGSILRNLTLVAATPWVPQPVSYLNNNVGHGISVKAQCHIENCYIQNFAGNGIHIVAPGQVPELKLPTAVGQLRGVEASLNELWDLNFQEFGDLYLDNAYEVLDQFDVPETHRYNGNAIDTRIIDVFCRYNRFNGIYILGSNSGNILIQSCHCQDNGGWGFYDAEKSTGNTYINCHAYRNALGEYYCLNAWYEYNPSDPDQGGQQTLRIHGRNGSACLYLNCYQETSWDFDPLLQVFKSRGSRVYGHAVIVTGQLGADGYNNTDPDPDFAGKLADFMASKGGAVVSAITGGPIIDPTISAKPAIIRLSGAFSYGSAEFPNGLHALSSKPPLVGISLGGQGKPGAAITLIPEIKNLAAPETSLIYAGADDGWWHMQNQNGNIPFAFSDENADIGSGHFWMPQGFHIGLHPNRNQVLSNNLENGVLAIDPQQQRIGDIILNDDPALDPLRPNKAYAGYMCVRHPQTGNQVWAGFGKLELLE